MAEEKTKEKKIAVVSELPTQALREVEMDGVAYECFTITEALTEILETVRKLDKKI